MASSANSDTERFHNTDNVPLFIDINDGLAIISQKLAQINEHEQCPSHRAKMHEVKLRLNAQTSLVRYIAIFRAFQKDKSRRVRMQAPPPLNTPLSNDNDRSRNLAVVYGKLRPGSPCIKDSSSLGARCRLGQDATNTTQKEC